MENSSTNSKNKTDFESLSFQAREYLSDKDLSVLKEAYLFAKEIYGSQALTENECILDHQLEVASIIASMRLDLETLVAALLGRTIGLDSKISISDVKEKFGEEVSTIVESISRISAIQFNPDLDFQAEKYVKCFLPCQLIFGSFLLCWQTVSMTCVLWICLTNRTEISPGRLLTCMLPYPAGWVLTG